METLRCSSGSRRRRTGKTQFARVKTKNIFKYLQQTVCPYSEPCAPYRAPDDRGFTHCRYQTGSFAIGITHTVFFLNEEMQSLCSSVTHRPVSLSHHRELTCLSQELTEYRTESLSCVTLHMYDVYFCACDTHAVKAHPPVNVSSHDPGDGGRCLTWSSPYSASSTLSKNLSYQLSYRSVKQDTWTVSIHTRCSLL